MTAGVGILRPEGRTEGIDPAQGQGIDFRLELAADGQTGPAPEKILLKALSPLCICSGAREVTVNISPAPSQSLVVMIGVWT